MQYHEKMLSSDALGSHLIIGFSGGVDSSVLLHMLANALEDKTQLAAVHINHQVSKYADQWVEHCKTVCDELGVRFIEKPISVNTENGESFEAVAREARYQIFAELLPEGATLLTAHTQSVQAETVLLQLMRGAGPKGLAAMPQKARFARGFLERPLLGHTREQILAYAEQHNLSWIEDESNSDIRFDRNFMRREIIPSLKTRWPSMTKTVARSSELMAEVDGLLDELAEQNYDNPLSIKKLLKLSDARQRNLIRYWLEKQGFPLPSYKKLKQLQQDILHAREDANPVIAWQDTEVRRYRDSLYVMAPLPEHDISIEIQWDMKEPLQLPSGLGELTREALQHLAVGQVTVRFRREGDGLKKFFQENAIPPWQRDRIPLVYVGNELVHIVSPILHRSK